MRDGRVFAFLDSTELSMDSSLQTARWDSLRRAVADRQLVLAVSEISIREVSRQVAERAEKYNKMVHEHGRQLRAHLQGLGAPEWADTSTFEAELRDRILSAGILVCDLPSISHADLLAREFAGRRPFKRNGTGYRDALIWMSFIEWIEKTAVDPVAVFFVTGNRNDFAGQTGALHLDLQSDLPPNMVVTLAEKLQPVVEAVRPPIDWLGVEEPIAVASAMAAAIAEVESYRGFPIEDLPLAEPYVDMPPFDRGFITSLSLSSDEAEATLVDRVEEIQIWDVAVSGQLTVEAQVWSWSEARDLPAGWQLVETPAGSDRPYVEGKFEGTWLVDVRIDVKGRAVDAGLTRVALQPPRRESTTPSQAR